MENNKAIGIFDSGVGGLSVLKSIREELPCEDLIYIADSKYAPYGEKDHSLVESRAIAMTEFLMGKGVKSIVIACNTATAAAVSRLRSMFTLPIVAIEPAVKPAVKSSRKGIVGILATTGTLNSVQFATLMKQFGKDAEVIKTPCPGLVEQVEKGDLTGNRTRKLLEAYIIPMINKGVDTIVLGCTHYPFLRPIIRGITGNGIDIIDTSQAVSKQLKKVLIEEHLLKKDFDQGKDFFWTSGNQSDISDVINKLWEKDAKIKTLPSGLL